MEQFLEDIKDLEVTTVARAQEAIDQKETATFFIGRKTCPYCRKFAAKLATVVAETKAHIYFINSEEPSQLDALQASQLSQDFYMSNPVKSLFVATHLCLKKKSKHSLIYKIIARDQSLAIFHFPKKSSKSFAEV